MLAPCPISGIIRDKKRNKGKYMINPNKLYNVTGKIVSIDNYTSMTVYKVQTKSGIFDYTVFGQPDTRLDIDSRVNVDIGYSIVLDGYFVKELNSTLKAA